MKKILTSILMIAFALCLGGCDLPWQKQTAETTEKPQTTQETQQPEEAETRIFVDSSDREVEIPTQIDKVAASGVPAQMVLFTVCPDKMVGLARQFSEKNLKYLDEKYQNMT